MSKERNGRISCRGIRKRGERGGGKEDGDRWVEREGEQGGDESTGLPAKPSFYLVGSVTGVQMPRPASPKSHFSYSILFPLFLPPYRFHSRSFRAVCVCGFAPLPSLCPDRTASMSQNKRAAQCLHLVLAHPMSPVPLADRCVPIPHPQGLRDWRLLKVGCNARSCVVTVVCSNAPGACAGRRLTVERSWSPIRLNIRADAHAVECTARNGRHLGHSSAHI